MLIAVGTSHRYCPIGIREKLVFSKKRIPDALNSLVNKEGIKACVILSTCNRIEIYAHSADMGLGTETLKKFLSVYHQQELTKIESYFYTYTDRQAMRHLFKVAAGVDSQIIGEVQILEQVRKALEQARAVEATDRFLDTVFAQAMQTALKVRQETGISNGEVSLASITLDLIKTRYNPINHKQILVIGVGKVSELLARILKKEKASAVFVSNRTYAKAVQLAKYIHGEAVGFDRLKEKVKDADIIISATSSPHAILRKEDFEDIQKPLLIIDLAVPRDIEPQVNDIKGVELFCLDDLDFMMSKSLVQRRQEIPKAIRIIEEEIDRICAREYTELEPAEASLH